MPNTIYLAEDEQNIRELIALFLRSEGFSVAAFSNGTDLMTAFEKHPADMLILDIMMPGIDGLTLCTRIREISNVPIIIVSALDSETDRITGITLGSDDYLTKPFSPLELVARVKALFRRLQLDRPAGREALLDAGNLRVEIAARRATVGGAPFDMTPTELALMVYLMQNAHRAVSREELLKNVWKFDFDVDTRATDDVVKRLRKKLSTAGADVRIESVWGFGFQLSQEAPDR